jgi:hypothetical protein
VEDNNNGDNKPWVRKRTLPYTLACTVKSRLGLAPILMTKKEEKEEKDACCMPRLGCLATYVGYVPCASVCLG